MQTYQKRAGFTLIELMVVIMAVSILATIAIPTYNQYMRKSQRGAAESQMLKIAADLERWRAKALSYKGFTPADPYATDVTLTTATNTTLYLPKGSTTSNYKYKIVILDGTDRTQSLSTGAGQQWVMIAQPNTTNSIMSLASRLVLNNSGVRCLSDQSLSDASMLANIKDSSKSDAQLCAGTSSAW
ncbi:type IV pilin protein [Aquirhabdus sp.]|uniref:type IV pilin protein n=1 Tax=Aquirhabdus sp. TaxID=2824160 RepID=UPI00396CA315